MLRHEFYSFLFLELGELETKNQYSVDGFKCPRWHHRLSVAFSFTTFFTIVPVSSLLLHPFICFLVLLCLLIIFLMF